MTRNCLPVPAVFCPLSFLSSHVCPKESEVVPTSLRKGNAPSSIAKLPYSFFPQQMHHCLREAMCYLIYHLMQISRVHLVLIMRH